MRNERERRGEKWEGETGSEITGTQKNRRGKPNRKKGRNNEREFRHRFHAKAEKYGWQILGKYEHKYNAFPFALDKRMPGNGTARAAPREEKIQAAK